MYCLTVQEATNLRDQVLTRLVPSEGCEEFCYMFLPSFGGFLAISGISWLAKASFHLYFLFTRHFPCVSVSMSKLTLLVRTPVTLDWWLILLQYDLIITYYIRNDPIIKKDHILKYWGGGRREFQHMNFRGTQFIP